MKLRKQIDTYLYDREYKIIIKENYANIVNYDEIIDFTLNKIAIRHANKIITIEGSNLIITKMVDDEVLVTGIINAIRIN